MIRQIYEVYAKVVDANGNYNTLSGYPKVFDSKLLDNDVDKALLKATGEFYETFGAMCKNNANRQLQSVILMTADGFVIETKSTGQLADLPEEEEE